MQSQIYQFEIQQAVINPVYLAKDVNNGKPVLLYEWTPRAEERIGSRVRLEALASSLEVEVFTADASLFMVAGSEAAADRALSILQANQLFPGSWLAPPSPPPSVVTQTATSSVSQLPASPDAKPKRRLNVWGILLIMILLTRLGAAIQGEILGVAFASVFLVSLALVRFLRRRSQKKD